MSICADCVHRDYCYYKAGNQATNDCAIKNKPSLCVNCADCKNLANCDIPARYRGITSCLYYKPINPDVNPLLGEVVVKSDLTITIGIEFEFNPTNKRFNRTLLKTIAIDCNLDYQDDYSCGFELRSPKATSIYEIAERVKPFFNELVRRRINFKPTPVWNKSLICGNHIHVGVREGLTINEAIKIAKIVKPIYPFLVAINNLSYREGYQSYRNYLSNYLNNLHNDEFIRANDHYCEINFTTKKTVEFRRFDGNIPQFTLSCAYILQKLAKRSLEIDVDEVLAHSLTQYLLAEYDNYMLKAYKNIALLNYDYFFNYLDIVGVKIDDNNVNHILSLAQQGINLCTLMLLNDKWEKTRGFYSKAYCNPIDNQIITKRFDVNLVKQLLSLGFTSLDDFEVEDKVEKLPTNILNKLPRLKKRLKEIMLIKRKAQFFNEINAKIVRISFDREKLPRLIAEFLNTYFNFNISADDVVNSPDRFYSLIMFNDNDKYEVIGVCQLNMRDNIIKFVGIKPNLQNKGLGFTFLRKLIHDLTLYNVKTYILQDNPIIVKVLTQLGFKEVNPHFKEFVYKAN